MPKTRKAQWEGRVPTGETTNSRATYLRAWRTFADKIGSVLGGTRLGYDPGVLLKLSDGGTVDLPQGVAETILRLAEKVATMQPADAYAVRESKALNAMISKRTKALKARWGGLPNSPGWWEWQSGLPGGWIRLLYVDRVGEVLYLKPFPDEPGGFLLEPSGQTTRTIGGVWGRRIAHKPDCPCLVCHRSACHGRGRGPGMAHKREAPAHLGRCYYPGCPICMNPPHPCPWLRAQE